jgi:hypothetical protein
MERCKRSKKTSSRYPDVIILWTCKSSYFRMYPAIDTNPLQNNTSHKSYQHRKHPHFRSIQTQPSRRTRLTRSRRRRRSTCSCPGTRRTPPISTSRPARGTSRVRRNSRITRNHTTITRRSRNTSLPNQQRLYHSQSAHLLSKARVTARAARPLQSARRPIPALRGRRLRTCSQFRQDE